MREIKFRFYHKLFNRFECGKMYSVSGDGKVLFMDGHDVTGIIIPLQYTGLKDKNGVEIYEGDLLLRKEDILSHRHTGPKFEVVFQQSSYLLKYKNRLCIIISKDKNYEVIGNIYENPELLGE